MSNENVRGENEEKPRIPRDASRDETFSCRQNHSQMIRTTPPPPPSLLWFLVDGSSLWRSPGRNTQSEKSCPKIQHHVLLTHVMHLTQSRTLWLVKSDFCFVDIFHLHFAVYLPVIKQLDNYLNRRIKDTCVLNNDVRRDSVSTTLFLIYIKYPYKI